MRICILSRLIPPASTEGIPRTRWLYAKAFADAGHEVHIITSTSEEPYRKIDEGIHIHFVSSNNYPVRNQLIDSGIELETATILSYSFSVCEYFRILNAQEKFDCIESPLWYLEGFFIKYLIPNIPLVLRTETTSLQIAEIANSSPNFPPQISKWEKIFLNLADAIVYDSHSVRSEILRLYKTIEGKRPIRVIHHGIDLPEVPSLRLNQNSTFNILIAGRLEKRKGSDWIVQTLLPELIKIPNVEIHFCGRDMGAWDGFKDSTGKNYTDYIAEHFGENIGKQIFCHGFVSDQNLRELYLNSSLALCLSRYESFGLLYIEAMKWNVPVVAFDSGAASEIIQHKVNGLLSPLEDLNSVLNNIKEIIQDSNLASTLVIRASADLREKYNINYAAQKCLNFFSEVIGFCNKKMRILQAFGPLTPNLKVQGLEEFFEKKGFIVEKFEPETISPRETDLLILHYSGFNPYAASLTRATLFKYKMIFLHDFVPSKRSSKQLTSLLSEFDICIASKQSDFDLLPGFPDEKKILCGEWEKIGFRIASSVKS
jgi:glycogen(starch) synthase